MASEPSSGSPAYRCRICAARRGYVVGGLPCLPETPS